MPVDKFNIKYLYPSKSGGFFYQMSDNPKNDMGIDFGSSLPDFDFPGAGILVMNPSGTSTDFGLGRNVRDFTDSIGGCDMDFTDTQDRGYAFRADDARDVEIKFLVNVESIESGNGLSTSACTGHHTGTNCCQGFAYMIDCDVSKNPTEWRFRKEMRHVSYHDSPEGRFTHSKSNFKIEGAGKYVGIGFCRYNHPEFPQTQVILEVWFNPDPDADINNWTMLKRIIDKPDNGWGNDGDTCGGAVDQVGTWSGAQNRVKTNSGSGVLRFKAVTLREIDPTGTFDTELPPTTTPPPSTEKLKYTYLFKWGKKGSGNGQFQDPHDITFDATADNLWVCDRVRNDVQKFTKDGTYISKFGTAGTGNGEFNVPYAIQIDPTNTYLYVCDRENNRVQKLTLTGTYVSKITNINGKNLKQPEDICFHPITKDIFICDQGNDRIIKLDQNHNFLLEWNGSAGGVKFDHPHSMDITTDNNYIIMNCGNQAVIQKFTVNGVFVKKWGSEGNGQGQVRTFLEHADIDAFGRFHLINNDIRPIINVWDQDGNWLCQYGSTSSGSADGQFKEPEHVTVHPNGNPYVVDAKNQRIQVFTPNFTTPPPTTPPPITPPTPSETEEVTGTFSLWRDINQYRTSPCSGTAPPSGGGSGTSGIFLGSGITPTNETKLSDSSTWSHRTIHTECCCMAASVMNNKIIKQINVAMFKVGSPAATPTVSAKIWDKNGTVVYTSPTTIDPSTLPTSFPAVNTSWALFDFSTNTHVTVVGDRVGVEYTGTSDTNYVKVGYEDDPNIGNHWVFQKEGSTWQEKKTRDAAMLFWS